MPANALGLAALGCAALAAVASPARAGAPRPPNVVFIVADDLGYGELGCYGQRRIRTPNIDQLAAEGLRFTRCYAGSPVCAPSRCVLLTGMHPGHAAIRDNREAQPEGQAPLPADAWTLAEALRGRGYRTGAFGKWGLGPMGSTGDPLTQGFDRFFGYNCQRAAHNHYPDALWDNSRRVRLRNHAFAAHQNLSRGADPADPASYARYTGDEYAPDRYSEEARAFMRESRDRPFFLLYATTVPHLGLQAPPEAAEAYAGAFDDPPYPGGRGYVPQRTPRAAYAGMITRLDEEVGRLVEQVRSLGLENDTLFVFTSDNGATPPGTGGADTGFFASNGALRGWKGEMHEGGIRVPLIVRWPGRTPAGAVTDYATGFEDWLPTLCELAGVDDARVRDVDGVSIVRTLRGRKQAARRFLYREFAGYGGWQAAWQGRWKAVRARLSTPPPDGPVTTQLYDLDADAAETRDVAADNPNVVRRLEALMRREHAPSPEFPLPRLGDPPRTAAPPG